MRSILVLPLAAAFALAACSDNGGADADGDGKITADEAAKEAAEGGKIAMLPGEWENTIQYSEFDMPGMPEDMKSMMMQRMAGGTTTKSCLTEQDVSGPDANFLKGEGQDNCTYHEFDRSGTSMVVRMTCDGGPGGGKVNVSMKGQFGPSSFKLALDNTVTGTPGGDMTMKGTITGKRIGDCPK